jgi:hypothetical protein
MRRYSEALMNAITMAIAVVWAVAVWIVPRLISYFFQRYTDTLLERVGEDAVEHPVLSAPLALVGPTVLGEGPL